MRLVKPRVLFTISTQWHPLIAIVVYGFSCSIIRSLYASITEIENSIVPTGWYDIADLSKTQYIGYELSKTMDLLIYDLT